MSTQTPIVHSPLPSPSPRDRQPTFSAHSSSREKPWQQHPRRPSFRSSNSRTRRPDPDESEPISHVVSRTSTTRSKKRVPKWWKIRLFKGMIDDVKRRAPYYWSDWTNAWDYRVVPATVYMYFANILPALAFSLDMFAQTSSSYGVNEVLLSSLLACATFSVLSAQPLVIVGVTGPITVFSYTVYDILLLLPDYDFFVFMAWIGIWSSIMHWILAATNSCNSLTYVTRFSCDTFGFYVAMVYLQKGIQVLTRQWNSADGATAAYLSITVALLVTASAWLCGVVGESKLFHRHVRKFIEDYGTPLTIVFFTGFVYIGRMREVQLERLPTSEAFTPTSDRDWFVHFWDVSVGEVFLAIPFAILLTILFWFDHNVSSLIAQGTEFPLRKPPGFHWDIFLLGITTLLAGLLGIPFPNGLIPQAPFHTQSLCVTKTIPAPHNEKSSSDRQPAGEGPKPTKTIRVVSHVVEQRLSNLAQGILFLITMTPPFLTVLHLIPQSVLAGLFFVMGIQALASNGITLKLLFLFRDTQLIDPEDPLSKISSGGRGRKMIWLFLGLELLVFAGTFAITQSIAAIGFPVIIIISIPFRTFVMPRWFTAQELKALDAPTAGPFVMESVGGAYGGNDDSGEATREEGGSESIVVDETERGGEYGMNSGSGGLSEGRPKKSDSG